MLRTKEILMTAGTLGCAVAIGFVMQSSDTAEKRYGTQAPVPLEGTAASNAVLDVQDITLTSGELNSDVVVPKIEVPAVIPASTPPSVLPMPETSLEVPERAALGGCDITATARPVAGAMVNVEMQAACLPNERLTIHHNGLIFTETTSATGTLELTVPALSVEAVFVLAFSNGEGAVAQTRVEELVDYDRAALQWKGETGFEIHAREFGANYGEPGHLWRGVPGDLAAAVLGESGVITLHGDTNAPDPLLAEVYSFPKGLNARAGTVDLSVEAEVTKANCGIEIEAQTLEIKAGGMVKTQMVTLPVPDCEAVGSFLVLNNLLQDMKVAGN